MPNQSVDKVISYSVHGDCCSEHYAQVVAALADGYRIVDVIQSTVTHGSGTNAPGFAVVTVVLFNPRVGDCQYLAQPKKR